MKESTTNTISRRQFIKRSTALAATTALLPSFLSACTGAQPAGIPILQLNNKLRMPQLGFGTLDLRGDQGARCVAEAAETGFRLFDTATIYGNEEAVGKGLKMSGINRSDLFITSKLWVDDSGFEQTKKAFDTSLSKLGTDYLDLYLIHRPRGDVKGSWQAMEELYKAGRIKAIGISNFEPSQLNELLQYATVQPAVNQIETHAFYQQIEQHSHLNNLGVQMEAWSPFAQGRNGMFTNETLVTIGKKYNKTAAQICLRWHMQRNVIAIPRTSQKAHMAENINIFDFMLTTEEMQTISRLDLNKTQFPEWS